MKAWRRRDLKSEEAAKKCLKKSEKRIYIKEAESVK